MEYSKYFCSRECEEKFSQANQGKIVSVPLVAPVQEVPPSQAETARPSPEYIESLASRISQGGGDFRTIRCSCGILLPVKNLNYEFQVICTFCQTPITVYPIDASL